MEAAFQEGLQTGELNLLSRVLRTYAIIDKTRDAEMLFREVSVKPYMGEVRSNICLLAREVTGNYYTVIKYADFVGYELFSKHRALVVAPKLHLGGGCSQGFFPRSYQAPLPTPFCW